MIPVYQAEKYIGATISSVLYQTFPDFELIIIDDGCTDRTVDVIQRFEDPRIRLIRQDNKGLSSARNAGFIAARGKYVAFLDADDLWFPHKLATDLRTLGLYRDQICLIYSGHYCVDDHYNLVNIPRYPFHGATTYETLLKGGTILPSSLLIHRDILSAVGGFPVGIEQFQEDRVFYAQVAPIFPAYPTGARTVLYRQNVGGLVLGALKSYEHATAIEYNTIARLRQELSEEQAEDMRLFHTRSLLNRFLKTNQLKSARRYASSVPVSLLMADVKGWLTILSLGTGFNVIYWGHIFLRFCLKYFTRPWWYFYRMDLIRGIREPETYSSVSSCQSNEAILT